MRSTSRYQGLARYMAARWPSYLIGCFGALAIVIFAWLSVDQGWYGFVALALVGMIALAYAVGVSTWSAHRLYDNDWVRDTLLTLGDIGPTDTLLYLNAGPAVAAVDYARRLTGGRLIVIDIYNPQLMPERARARERQQAPRPAPDPRISWRDGSIDLLPLPDSSVHFIVLNQTVSALWQPGDRHQLIAECSRVLVAGGRLLIAERVRNTTNALVAGSGVLHMWTRDAWDSLMEQAGLEPANSSSLSELIWCARYDKTIPSAATQLPLALSTEP